MIVDVVLLMLLSGAFIFPPSRVWRKSTQVAVWCFLALLAVLSLFAGRMEVLMVEAVVCGLDYLNALAASREADACRKFAQQGFDKKLAAYLDMDGFALQRRGASAHGER